MTALADILGPCDLADSLATVMIEKDEIFGSHDVVSLLTNTPINKAIAVISNRLKNYNTLKKRTNLDIDDMELCDFVLTTTNCVQRHHIQTKVQN